MSGCALLGAAVSVLAVAAPRSDRPKQEYIVNIPGLGVVAGISANASDSVAFFGGEEINERRKSFGVTNVSLFIWF